MESTIINTLRNLPSNSPSSAPIGITETTVQPTPYQHPSFPNVTFWDLPGVGTPNNPQSTYKKKMKLKSYDFFLITLSSRFTENTLWLANVLIKMQKPYFLIRSKLDLEIQQKRKQHPQVTDQDVMTELRNDIRMQTINLPRTPEIFVLSGELENTDRWDFPLLKQRILSVLPEVKRNILAVSLGGYAADLIESKYQVLKRRILYYALASALGSVVPVPGFSFGVDTALILKMAYEFARSFGLTSTQVQRTYVKLASRTEVVSIVGRTSAMLTVRWLLTFIASQVSSTAAEEVLRFIPLLGQGAAAVLGKKNHFLC